MMRGPSRKSTSHFVPSARVTTPTPNLECATRLPASKRIVGRYPSAVATSRSPRAVFQVSSSFDARLLAMGLGLSAGLGLLALSAVSLGFGLAAGEAGRAV